VESLGTELAGRLVGGDHSAVRDLYRACGRLVFTVAHRIVGDRGLAEEATQTTFVRLWQTADRIEPDRDLRPLVCTIARRVAIDIARRERRRPWSSLEEATAVAGEDDDGIERAWTTWRVRESVLDLSAEEQEVVRLQHHVGLTHTEIAERLGVALGTVKSRSHRAHRRLATLLHDLRGEVNQ
jgi:RNA polymerase sigma-70 factor (ECF subfamily)